VHGDGEQSRDFTHISDVVRANLLALEAEDAAGEVFNVARGKSHSLNELVAELNDLLGTSIEPIYGDPRPGDVQHSLADISKARERLGYQPEISFRQGLQLTLDALAGAAI
jgi:nucleoside-diphosphate-sugar epimerase